MATATPPPPTAESPADPGAMRDCASAGGGYRCVRMRLLAYGLIRLLSGHQYLVVYRGGRLVRSSHAMPGRFLADIAGIAARAGVRDGCVLCSDAHRRRSARTFGDFAEVRQQILNCLNN